MATTIRVDEEDKRNLEHLQARIILQTSEKLSFTEIIHYLLRLSQTEQFEELIKMIKPLKDIDWKTHEIMIEDMGFENSGDIDKVVYGA